MEFVSAIIGPFVNIVTVPITDRLRYMMFCKKYVRDMQTKMRELEVIIVSSEEHINHNRRSRLEIPSQVRGWLEEVEGIKANVQNFPSGAIGCFNLNTRHKLGRKALKIIDQIESFTRQYSSITWTDRPIPLGKIDSMKASTSTPSTDHRDFDSREATFAKALKALEPDHKSHMNALCGMGGVGKTTMMKRLKKVVQERKMFRYIVEVVISENTDPIAIQGVVSSYLGIELKEPSKSARAERLRKWFEGNSDGGKTKFLIILDDVWQSVDLEDIGLSHFPIQGVDFKVLLTSRNSLVCSDMGVEVDSIFNVELLTESEAQSLFHQISGTDDPELQNIGVDIVRKCRGLPIAIKTITCTLKNKIKSAWSDALTRLEHYDLDDFVNEVFKLSYENIQDEETKSTFLLCGLFPEDFNIPTEILMRYGWGLKIFKRVSTIREARNRLNTCIERLRETNLLIKSDDVGCVKMHDLVRAFVLHVLKEAKHASILNHGSMSGTWPEEDDMISGPCKRISLTCKGMSEIPQYLNNFPNLSLLKLMYGDKSLRFPQGFYGEMKMLQVISYDQMKYPLLPSSPQFSTNLRVLHLHKCSLMMFDCSSIGNHLNLEVLSFSNSEIECLPSTIRNLKKLRLLDLTNCARLRIDNGVLQNFVKLEELYMGATGEYGKAISLTDENYNEIRECSENLGALEFEFFKNDVQPKKMSFERLQRFNISVGCSLDRDFCKRWHSFGNTLNLGTDKDGVKESEMNQLFEKAEVLYLTVGDMKDLSDVEVESSHAPQPSSFRNLRVLVVSECVELRHLFTVDVVNTLSKLEHLQVQKCNNMEEVVHNGGNGEKIVTFPQLKFLCLGGLPKLLGLCHNINKFQLPQLVELKLDNIPGFTSIYPDNKLETSSLLKKEVVIPKLEKLCIEGMENLKEIWPCEFESEEVNVPMLKEIRVKNCDSLVNLFPSNPMPFIHHLEDLDVNKCCSIEVLFNIDLERVGEIQDEGSRGSSLRRIEASKLGNLREVWRIKGAYNSHLPITDFQFVERIHIEECRRFKNVFSPTTTNFDLGACVDIYIKYRGENPINNEAAESIQEKEINNEAAESIQEKEGENQINNEATESIQEKEGENQTNNEAAESIQEKEGENQISNEAAESIQEEEGENHINNEAVESIKEEEFSEAGDVSWSLCQYATEIQIWNCHALSCVIPWYAAGQMQKLQVLRIFNCNGMKEVFETEGMKRGCDEDVNDGGIQHEIPRLNVLLKLPNLKRLYIVGCDLLEHVFPFLALESLKQLQQLEIRHCKGMKVIVKEEDGEKISSSKEEVVVFPRLKSIELYDLPELAGFFLGMNEFRWPSLDYVRINNCPQMTAFTRGGSRAPQLKYMHTSLGKYTLGESGLNFHLPVITTTAHHDQTPLFPISYAATSQQGIPCSFHNLIHLNMEFNHGVEKIIPSNELLQLQNLEKIRVWGCSKVEEVFEAGGGNSSRSSESQTTTTTTIVNLPNLREMELYYLNNLRYIWKSNEWTAFQFPNLTTISFYRCDKLQHAFSSSMVGSLLQLQQLIIKNCENMEEVVEVVTNSNDGVEEAEEEYSHAKTNQLTFPRLNSLKLEYLKHLKGFCLGKEDFSFPLLDTLSIMGCPAIVTFTNGHSAAPKLREIEIKDGSFYAAGKDINSIIKIKQEDFKKYEDPCCIM